MLTRELSPPEIKAPNTKIVKTCFRPDAKYLVQKLADDDPKDSDLIFNVIKTKSHDGS